MSAQDIRLRLGMEGGAAPMNLLFFEGMENEVEGKVIDPAVDLV